MRDHIYPTIFLIAVLECVLNQRVTCFVIRFRGHTIWNKLLTGSEKTYTTIAVFKTKIKEKIQNFSNKVFFLTKQTEFFFSSSITVIVYN